MNKNTIDPNALYSDADLEQKFGIGRGAQERAREANQLRFRQSTIAGVGSVFTYKGADVVSWLEGNSPEAA